MTNTATIQDLSKRIEEVVQEHIAASHRVAVAALERAFAKATSKPSAPAKTQRVPAENGSARRRAREELTAIGERFYQAVCAKPGASMTVLAADVGATPRTLNRPMVRLKNAGKIRSVGQRHLTRYFPLVGEASGQA